MREELVRLRRRMQEEQVDACLIMSDDSMVLNTWEIILKAGNIFPALPALPEPCWS